MWAKNEAFKQFSIESENFCLGESPKFQNLFVMGQWKSLNGKKKFNLGRTPTINLPIEGTIAGTHALVKRY
jgi:hypothetical protein